MKMRWGCLSLAFLLLAVACRGETPQPGPDILAGDRPTTDRTPLALASSTPAPVGATPAHTTTPTPHAGTASPRLTSSNPLMRTLAAGIEDDALEGGSAALLPTNTPTPTRRPLPTPTPLDPSVLARLLSTPWRFPTPSGQLRQAVFMTDLGSSTYRYLPSPGNEDFVPGSDICKFWGVIGLANFANLIICPSALEGGEEQDLVTDMFGKQVYRTLGPEVGWRWSPDDLHLIAEPDEEWERKGTIYHLLTGGLEDWPYTCDRVALSPRSGRLATWCRSVPEGEAFGVIEWGGVTWISPQAPAEVLVQTTPEIDWPGWLWGWAADGEKIAYFNPSGNLTIANSQGASLLILPGAIDWQSFIDGPLWPLDDSIKWAANGERVLIHVRGRADKPCPTHTNLRGEVYENPPCWQVIDAHSGAVIWHAAETAKVIGEETDSSPLLEGDIQHIAISADGRYLAIDSVDSTWMVDEEFAIVDVDTNTIVWKTEERLDVNEMRWAEVPSDASVPPWPPIPVAAPAPTAPPTPTPAVVSGLALADTAALQTILWDYRGLWSPAYDEMVGQYKQPGEGTIGLATAPDFSLRKVDLSQSGIAVFDPTFSWSPDGNNIIFLGPGEVNVSHLWRMDRKGQNPRLALPGDEAHFWQRFAGWLDERTVAVVDNASHGYSDVYIIDFLAGKLLSWADFIGGPIFTPNHDYVPAVDFGLEGFRQLVVARQLQEEPYQEMYIDNPYTHAIPQEAVSAFVPQGGTVFKDWLPGTNQMLVQAFVDKNNDGHSETSRLLLWDVEGDEVRDVAANGVDGKYSPDGRWLAAVTLGASALNEDGTLALSPTRPIPEGAEPFLYLLEAATGKVVLNTAVMAAHEGADFIPDYLTQMSFSPDGRYLVFAAPGQVVVDESGWPAGMEGDAPSINVLDLSERRLLRSVAGEGLALAWSPTGDRLAYRDSDLQWQVYDLRTDALVELTTSGGEMVERAAWSHTGRYLALYVTQADGVTHTVVLWMGE